MRLRELTGATLGYLPEGGNAVGAHLAGVLPHRDARRSALSQPPGLNVADMFAGTPEGLHPVRRHRAASSTSHAERRVAALKAAEFVVALSPYGDARRSIAT